MAEQADIQHAYDGDGERQQLSEVMVLMYLAMLVAVQRLVTMTLRLQVIDLSVDKVAVRRFALEASARAVLVDATTQKTIAELIARGQTLGLSNWEIANGSRDGTFGGIEGLFEKTWKDRAEMVVRTELQKAAIDASVDRFRASNVVKWVRAHDGDHDERCAARNGRLYPIENPPQLLHPNCRLSVSPSGGP